MYKENFADFSNWKSFLRIALTAACSSRKAIAARISFLKEQLKDLNQRIKAVISADPQLAQNAKLIASIPGIGAWTAAVLLSELPEISPKTSARQIAALFGLVPKNVQSGTSVRRKASVGKPGRLVVRHQMYMPALVALKFNEAIRTWADGLRERGKTGKQIVLAVIHRLMRFVVGVLKTRQEFRLDWKTASA